MRRRRGGRVGYERALTCDGGGIKPRGYRLHIGETRTARVESAGVGARMQCRAGELAAAECWCKREVMSL